MTIQANFPAIKPSLLLDFANVKQLDPRINYTRASTATFYNGVTTAKAEENLVLQSQTFDNASWVKTTATVTADSFAAPDGTTTADTLTATNTNATLLQTFTATATAYTFSVYIYRKTGTGNVDITVDGTTFATQSITGAWVRYSITTTPTAGSKTAGIRLATNGDEVYIWGAQLENRSSATAYTATTTQAITNYIPTLQTAASGVARFDNNPTTGESLGLLIEESRTNLVTYSSDYSNAAWTKTNTTITSAANVAPDGTQTAQKVVESTSSSGHELYEAVTLVSGNSYTWSGYFKAAGRNWVAFLAQDASGNTTYFDLQNGVVGTNASGNTASITSVGNGWYRCTLTRTVSGTSGYWHILTASANNTVTYTGDGFSGLFVWGAQVEAGAFATSYIPTVASQVTRAADAASMTGTNFSSWYNQAEGTFYGLGTPPNAGLYNIFSINNNSNVERIQSLPTNGTSTLLVISGSAIQAQLNTSALAGTNQVAVTYKVNDFAASRNSATVLTDTTGVVPLVTKLDIGSHTGVEVFNGTIKKIAYYPVRIQNSQLQALTS